MKASVSDLSLQEKYRNPPKIVREELVLEFFWQKVLIETTFLSSFKFYVASGLGAQTIDFKWTKPSQTLVKAKLSNFQLYSVKTLMEKSCTHFFQKSIKRSVFFERLQITHPTGNNRKLLICQRLIKIVS